MRSIDVRVEPLVPTAGSDRGSPCDHDLTFPVRRLREGEGVENTARLGDLALWLTACCFSCGNCLLVLLRGDSVVVKGDDANR
jgi:hypothetical protein